MKFYRMEQSVDFKIVGKYPPFETGYFPVDANDPRLMLNIFFTKVNEEEVYTTVPKLVKRAKLTDFMPGTSTGNIISERLKNLIEETHPIGMQFIFQKIIVNNEEIGGYWLTNNYLFDYSVLDFEQTEISIMKSVWDVDYTIKVENKLEFLRLIDKTPYPRRVKIFKPNFIENFSSDFFALRYVYNGSSFFCSERFREKLEGEKIAGIRYMELDEVL